MKHGKITKSQDNKENIFSFENYKKYLLNYISSQPGAGHGVRRRFAEAAQCQPAYVSHVLGGENHFSSEQAQSISRYLGHTKAETKYFILLVEEARAGTSELKLFYRDLLNEVREDHLSIKKRVSISNTLSREDQSIYYSSWHYSAIHMALTISGLRQAEQLAERLHLPTQAVRKVLSFLEQKGIIERSQDGFRPKGDLLWLEKDSPLIIQHHSNWRLRAMQTMSNSGSDDIHSSMCFSVATHDVPKLRELLTEFNTRAAELIKPSKEERLFALNLDFFEV